MADIKTILRELSVILGYIVSKYGIKIDEKHIDVKTFLALIKKYCKNINECNSEIVKIQELDSFSVHYDIIENGISLGKLIYKKLDIKGDIYWLGSKVNLKYPYDIKIGETGISLKEDSYILKNPSFADYLNALVQPQKPFENVHVFRRFAPNEFEKWYKYTYKKLFDEFYKYQNNEDIYSYTKRQTFIKKGMNGLIFGKDDKTIEIKMNENLDEISLNAKLGGYIFEHTISKWIKKNLEKCDSEYEKLKKDCSLKAGENLKDYIQKYKKLNTSKILELLQIYENTYYFGKSHGGSVLYQVPTNKECKIKLMNIVIKVPKSQLNVYFYFEISNIDGTNPVEFRVECRYSHGQFKGIPEAKLYYTDNINHLKNLYRIVK